MNRILLRIPATTANVGPGYDIFSMALAEPYDELEIKLNDSNKINITIEGSQNNNIPVRVEDNSGGLAALELLKRKNIKQGIELKLIKKMPSGCGLGTTGATAAGTLYGLNELLGLNMQSDEMIEYARFGEIASGGSPHADNVASALLGGFVLVKSYNPIEVLKIDVPEIYAVITVIKKGLRTTRGFITYEIGQEKLKEQMARCSRVIHSLLTGDVAEFGAAVSVDHIAEPVRGAAIPAYFESKKTIIDGGAYGCTISGGGSSVISFCTKELQDKMMDIMYKAFGNNPNFITIIKTRTSNKGVTVIEKS
ncbi:MAG: homoserine kinase [Bacteroidales bacterium]|nr:homoserine kinase [Bacteroidales bacterium]